MGKWTADIEKIAAGHKYHLRQGGAALSFRELFRLLAGEDDFADWYGQLLAASDYRAFYWEHPPLTSGNVDRDAEFVLIDAPVLATLPADPAPFQSQFEVRADESVIAFPNLGGDAVLVAPGPKGPDDAYPHLAAFVRHAPEDQLRELWRVTSRAVEDSLSSAPIWLSTAGLGVTWLHIRLDTRPKYYSHAPYKGR